eukprot:1794199-Rhodomonas_salina.1
MSWALAHRAAEKAFTTRGQMEGFEHCIFKSWNNRWKARLLAKPAAADLRRRFGFGWCGHVCWEWLKHLKCGGACPTGAGRRAEICAAPWKSWCRCALAINDTGYTYRLYRGNLEEKHIIELAVLVSLNMYMLLPVKPHEQHCSIGTAKPPPEILPMLSVRPTGRLPDVCLSRGKRRGWRCGGRVAPPRPTRCTSVTALSRRVTRSAAQACSAPPACARTRGSRRPCASADSTARECEGIWVRMQLRGRRTARLDGLDRR